MRVLFLQSAAAKQRLKPALSEGNVAKTMVAPVVALTAYDLKFFEHAPYLMPHVDVRPWFEGNEAFATRSAFQNGTLQVAYLILALRAVGLDTGPMSGFDTAKADAEFFPDGRFKSNVLINIGYGDHSKLFPRSPRFSFDQIAQII
jgi:3-hydroxypropanoate dehydrogenase